MESDVVSLQDVFTFDFGAGVDLRGRFRGALRPSGVRPVFLQRLSDLGIDVPARMFVEEL
jgi:pilus assembly protein CpaF